jgi:hypothetical protein
MSPLCKPLDHLVSRRAFLGGAVASLATPLFAGAMKQRDKQVLFIWLDGGLSQLESWDPKPDTTYGGPFRSIKTSVPGVHLSELMPKLAQQMHRLCVVRSMKTREIEHRMGIAAIQRGDPKNRGVPYPYFGSGVAKLLGPGGSGMPPYVTLTSLPGGFIAEDAGFLGPKFGSLAFSNGKPPENLLRVPEVGADQDAARNELRAVLDRRYSVGRSNRVVEANASVFDMADKLIARADVFDTSKFSEKDKSRYGNTNFGNNMLLARQMLEAGVRFVKVTSINWDTHWDNFNAHASLVPRVDMALGAMLEDLAASGLLDSTLVICASEFGRTPRINGANGRDHWNNAWSIAMAGHGIKHGLVVGETDELGLEVKTRPHDIGALAHTWYRALGINPDETKFDNGGQPLPIAHDEMTAIEEALA